MRLIDADELKKTLDSKCDICPDKNTNWCKMVCFYNDIEFLIDNAPTVESDYEWGYSEGVHDTERPQGDWIYVNHGYYECSECKHVSYEIKSNFCPNCGADMRGGAE